MAKRASDIKRSPDGTTQRERRKLYKLARQIGTQSDLEDVLLDISHRHLRSEVFYLLKPMLTFNAVYPEWLNKIHRIEPYKAV